ncbi:MAG: OmpA family protein [Ketobacteraceae bacterium]|nr:OmpA family protein [Ketobacteraceae bacterium]
MLRILSVILMLLLSGALKAHEFLAGIDAEWHLEPGPLKCRLWQGIPQYGMAIFEIDSGSYINFYLESDRVATAAGSGKLEIRAPFWRPGPDPVPVTELKTRAGKHPVLVNRQHTDRIVDELVAGMMPTFVINGWTKDHEIEVGVSPVNFQEAYNGFASCLATLYPVNYQQIASSHLLFGLNKYGLSQEARDRLDLIAGYVLVDPEVRKIAVHGHASQEGRRGHNWELSRLRAKEVKDYLVSKGVDPERIVTNYYGETRPRNKGATPAERALNRRVYVSVKKPRY